MSLNNVFSFDLDKIIQETLESLGQGEHKNLVNEALVAEDKPFQTNSDKLSSESIVAHKQLYSTYVGSFNKVSNLLDTVDRNVVDSRSSVYRSLKLDETYNLNSVWLHELYFAGCFDPNSQVRRDSLSYMRLSRDWGNFSKWQEDFIASAMSCGEGWAVTGYHLYLKRYITTFVSHHSADVMVGLYPIVVVDMWAHAYCKDNMNDKASYLVGRMKEFNWAVIEERFKKAEQLGEALK